MARRSKSHGGRDTSDLSLTDPLLDLTPLPRLGPVVAPPLPSSDRRFYDPTASVAPLPSRTRDAPRIVDKPRNSRGRYTASRLNFAVPDHVMVCNRRKERREVMFAKKKAGRVGQKKPRRNFWSKIGC